MCARIRAKPQEGPAIYLNCLAWIRITQNRPILTGKLLSNLLSRVCLLRLPLNCFTGAPSGSLRPACSKKTLNGPLFLGLAAVLPAWRALPTLRPSWRADLQSQPVRTVGQTPRRTPSPCWGAGKWENPAILGCEVQSIRPKTIVRTRPIPPDNSLNSA